MGIKKCVPIEFYYQLSRPDLTCQHYFVHLCFKKTTRSIPSNYKTGLCVFNYRIHCHSKLSGDCIVIRHQNITLFKLLANNSKFSMYYQVCLLIISQMHRKPYALIERNYTT